jgi:hypothetical protein
LSLIAICETGKLKVFDEFPLRVVREASQVLDRSCTKRLFNTLEKLLRYKMY